VGVHMAVAVHMSTCMGMCSSFLRLHKRVHNKMSGPQLLNLFLHCFFEDAFLRLYQASLLLVILNAILVPPSAVPPAAPRVLAGGTAVGRCIAALFAKGGAFGPSSEAATAVTNNDHERATAE
jgi:hypothetical protein